MPRAARTFASNTNALTHAYYARLVLHNNRPLVAGTYAQKIPPGPREYHISSGNNALAGCVTTSGLIRRSPRLKAPYPAEDLAEVAPGVAAKLARVTAL